MQAKRSLLCTYLRTNAMSEQNPTWSLIGDGFSTNSISMEPDSEDTQYINQDSATTILKRYKPTMSLEGVIEMSETVSGSSKSYTLNPVFEYVNNLRRSREVSNESELLIVELYSGTLNTGTNVWENCYAQRQKINMQIEDFGGEAGDTISFSATINFQGDPTDSTSTYNVLNTSARTIMPSSDKVTVTYTLTGCTATGESTSAYKGTDLSATITPSVGHYLPSSITVVSGATTLVANTDYTYNQSTGKIAISGSKITGAITITAIADHTVTVTASGSNTTHVGDATAITNRDYTITFTAASGYHLPDSVTTIKNGATDLTVTTDYTYDKTTGVIVVLGSKITDNLTITVDAVSD